LSLFIIHRNWKALQNWDGLGAGASALCFVHCLLGPVIFVVSPGLAHLIPGDEYVHRGLAIAILAFGVLAVHSGYRIHRRKRVLVVIASGLLAIIVAAIAGDEMGSHAMEVSTTVLGSALLVYGHGLNRQLCRECGKCAGKSHIHYKQIAGINGGADDAC
jgi:peptidoglycan/LPS O-acetylase OafA/YrhL